MNLYNYIIKDEKLNILFGYHESDNNIQKYFNDTFNLEDDFKQNANIFVDNVPDLKIPKIGRIKNLFRKHENDQITLYDFSNAKKLFESLKLNRVQACDPRLWAYLCHGPFYSFIKQRYYPNKDGKIFKIENYYNYDEKVKQTIKNFIKFRFFTGSDSRTLRRNGIAFLWWAAELTFAPWEKWNNIVSPKEDKYFYTKFILDNPDVYANTFERSLGREPKVLYPLLDIIINNKLSRAEYRDLIKKVNSELYYCQYSTLSIDVIKEKLMKLLV